MKRLPDWSARLEGFFDQNAHRTFRYGRWDCCLFACEAICAMTAVDVGGEFRDRYNTRAEARARIKTVTGKSSVRFAVDYVVSQFGLTLAPGTDFAQRGDVAIIKRATDYSLGIVGLNGSEIKVLTAKGIDAVPISAALKVWHV